MTAPTKADPLLERLQHAFGEKLINDELSRMMRVRYGNDPLDWLTDEARDVLVYKLISSHRTSRRYAAQNRKIHRERQK